ncbi:MAG: hypothetical protein JNM41_07740 [Flavipsychrobacter sp.]|nr:hypothetical protein [Flavipsychrobacter sp.]
MSKRKASILDNSIVHGTIVFAIDTDCASSILPYIFRDQVDEEFKQIRDIIKQGIRNKEKYCKCDVSDKAHNMYEMRFRRNGRNDRIYCQEVSRSGVRYIIMCELYEGKKTQDIPKKIKSRIETMGGYEYEIK